MHQKIIGFILMIGLCAQQHATAQPTAEQREELTNSLTTLQQQISQLSAEANNGNRTAKALVADVEIFAKAVEWQLRHDEFPRKEYVKQALAALRIGTQRAKELASGEASWELKTGATIRGYYSKIDGSVQPYGLRLPEGVDPTQPKLWPLYVKLHGRANDMNETNFISRHEGKSLEKDQTWVQLDVYGRGNNAYRWAGETDVFEAIADVRRRLRIDTNRITLHGFSMGGAGAWHLGLHYPAMWSSVGPGAGFVDFYKYQKQAEQRPPWQHATLGIYDAIDYTLNAANVPVCTYGGEKDAQLVASTSVNEAAKALDVDIKLLIGPGMGHKFHPDSYREFMAFHKEKSTAGRTRGFGRSKIRFTTRYLKYNTCDWLTINEIPQVYEPATVEAELKNGDVEISTENIAVLSIARDAGTNAIIDGDFLPCYNAADGLLPNVYYERTRDGWSVLSYDDSKAFLDNRTINKRKGLQGPIDDAFTEPFICVLPTSSGHNARHTEWVEFTYRRFAAEFDKWMRARIQTVKDSELTAEQIQTHNLILFGDPSSNSIIKKLQDRLPVKWSENEVSVGKEKYNTAEHGLSLVYPNPLNRNRYVVINSGHTFHEADFKASNAWLFPRLGDIAIQQFSKQGENQFTEKTVWAANFNSGWRLPVQE